MSVLPFTLGVGLLATEAFGKRARAVVFAPRDPYHRKMILRAPIALGIAVNLVFAACADEVVVPVQRSFETVYPATRTDDASASSPDTLADISHTDLAPTDDAGWPDAALDVELSDADASPPVEPVCEFEPWEAGLIGGSVNRIYFDPRALGLVWATSNAGLLRSTDGGLTFESRADELGLGLLAFPADDLKRLVGVSARGLVESQDAGVSITPLALSGLGMTAIAASPVQPTRVWLGTNGGGLLRSDNGGTSFNTSNVGVPYGQVFAIAASPDSPDVALVGMGYRNLADAIENRGAILRTMNGGRSWSIVSEAVSWGNQIIFCPSDSSRVYAAVRRGILESFDGGVTWAPLPQLQNRDVLDVGFGAGGCDDLWAVVYQDALYRIDLAAETLSGPLRAGITVEASRFQARLAPHPIDPDALVIATAAGIFRTADGGQSFSAIAGPRTLSFTNIAGSFDTSGEVLLGTSGAGLWRRNGDEPWARVPEVPYDTVFSVYASPSDHRRVAFATPGGCFVTTAESDTLVRVPAFQGNLTHALWRDELGDQIFATQTGGFFRSTDGGITVTPMNDGLAPWATPNGFFIDARYLLRHPTIPGALLAATRGRGVAQWDPTEARWSLIPNELAFDEVYRLTMASGDLYAVVLNKGVMRSVDAGLTWQAANAGLDSASFAAFDFDEPSGTFFGIIDGRLFSAALQNVTEGSPLRWRPLGRFCFDHEVRLQGLGVIGRLDGGRDLILSGNLNRIWRLALESAP